MRLAKAPRSTLRQPDCATTVHIFRSCRGYPAPIPLSFSQPMPWGSTAHHKAPEARSAGRYLTIHSSLARRHCASRQPKGQHASTRPLANTPRSTPRQPKAATPRHEAHVYVPTLAVVTASTRKNMSHGHHKSASAP